MPNALTCSKNMSFVYYYTKRKLVLDPLHPRSWSRHIHGNSITSTPSRGTYLKKITLLVPMWSILHTRFMLFVAVVAPHKINKNSLSVFGRRDNLLKNCTLHFVFRSSQSSEIALES